MPQKKSKHILFLTAFSLIFCYCTFAQIVISGEMEPQFEKGKYYQITSIYGTTYRGPVLEETNSEIVILDKKTNTKHRLQKKEIKNIASAGSSKAYSPSRFDEDYYTNYYMIAENALPYTKGEFNTTSHYLIMTNMNYSFNEHWAMSFNLMVFLPISIGVKFSYPIADNLYFGGNVYVYGFPSDKSGYYCPLFGAAARITKGDNVSNFTLGGGIMAINNEVRSSPNFQPTDPFFPVYYIDFAYSNRFAKHFAFTFENFLFPQNVPYQQATVNMNITGVSLKWLANRSDHWNVGVYCIYVGDYSNINKNSDISILPYVGYSAFFK